MILDPCSRVWGLISCLSITADTGRSGGSPSVSSMMKDCHTIYDFCTGWMSENGFNGKIIVMGRSLGSASATELVSGHGGSIDALIIDSGFALCLAASPYHRADPDRSA